MLGAGIPWPKQFSITPRELFTKWTNGGGSTKNTGPDKYEVFAELIPETWPKKARLVFLKLRKYPTMNLQACIGVEAYVHVCLFEFNGINRYTNDHFIERVAITLLNLNYGPNVAPNVRRRAYGEWIFNEGI